MSSDLEADRALLARTSTAEKVADILRTRILQGFFPPGSQLVEGSIDGALGISRNTLREAFRLLTHEGLLVHELNRGMFVKVPSKDDLADIYRVRRLVECQAARELDGDRDLAAVVDRIGEIVKGAEEANAEQRYLDVGTADIRFHQEIAALLGSPHVDTMMSRVLAELRLVFHVMSDPLRFHQRYVARNKAIYELLADGEGERAAEELRVYLDDAERQLTDAYDANPER